MRALMRLRRAFLPATWLLGTLLATAIVHQAVNAVQDQVAERRAEPLTAASVRLALNSPGQGGPTASQPAQTAATTVSPGGPTPPTPSPRSPGAGGPGPTPQPVPAARKSSHIFDLVGGTASVTCSGVQVSLDWATPHTGFQVETGTGDGGARIDLRFRSDTHESRLEAWCLAGQVQSSVREESS